jgi:hypothetical protein
MASPIKTLSGPSNLTPQARLFVQNAIQPIAAMTHRLHDMLFNHASGNPQVLGDLRMTLVVKSMEQKDLPTPGREFRNGAGKNADSVLVVQDAFRVGRVAQQKFGVVTLDKPVSANALSAEMIDRQIAGDPEQVGLDVPDRSGGSRAHELEERLLHQVVSRLVRRYPPLEKAMQIATVASKQRFDVPTRHNTPLRVENSADPGIVIAKNR